MPSRPLPRPEEMREVGALDVGTEVPTPHGTTTIGDLRPGNAVFGSDGRTVQVADVTDVAPRGTCYEIEFSTGERIVVDDEQRLLIERRDRPRAGAVLVRRPAGELAAGVAACGPSAYAVRVAPAIRIAEKKLPVDPYLFGAWIGSGPAHLPAVRGADEELVTALTRSGARVFTSDLPGLHWVAVPSTLLRRGTDLTSRLREMRVLGAKHLPTAYRRASLEQRRALLAGLLDSSARISDGGEIVLRPETGAVAVGVHELIASLGFRPRYQLGATWVEVRFFASPKAPVFTRESLQEQLQVRRRLAAELRPRRLVVGIREVGPRPLRRVRIGGDDGILLVGRSFIPLPGTDFEPVAQVTSPA